MDRLSAILAPYAQAEAVAAVTMLLDGAIVQAIALGRPLDGDTLEAAIRAVIGA